MDTVDDVTLVVEGQKIECSKTKLAQHSEYFKIMFEGNFSERDKDTITMNDVDFEALRICIKMFENKSFIPENGDLPIVLQTACMLQFTDIIDIVSNKLLFYLNINNCINVWFLTEPLNLTSICLEAKKMSLLLFKAILDQVALLKLTMEELHKYLGHIHLMCNEFEVFRVLMNWHSVNPKSNVIHLLACLDFNRLSNIEITEMMKYGNVRTNLPLVNVLQSVIAVRKGECVGNDLVQKLLKCNHRGYWIEPLFFESVESEARGSEDEEHQVAEGDDQSFWMALHRWLIDERYIEKNFEYKLVSHNQQIFLIGEEIIGSSSSLAIWKYNSFRKRWYPKHSMRLFREQCVTCLVGNVIYVVGGKPTRKKTTWTTWTSWTEMESDVHMSVYSLTGESKAYETLLPVLGSSMKCCSYAKLNQLFLYYNELKSAYLYDYNDKNYISLKMDKEIPIMEENFSLFYLDDYFFVKDKTRLVQLQIVEDKLRFVKISKVAGNTFEVCDKSELCHDTTYRMHKRLNILTMEGEMICRNQDGDGYRIGKAKYVFNTYCKMLLPTSCMLAEKDKYVNTIENIN